MGGGGGGGGTRGGGDPRRNVQDLEGTAHYDVLKISRDATAAQIKSAYRAAARVHHPDKGGDASVFAKVQLAFEVLIDPKRRETYDALAAEHAYRFIPGVTPRARGGESVLLDDLERLGVHSIDGGTQLVALCEVCGRPSTKICYACECRYCDFCSRKLHWKGGVGLHYPVSDAPGSMRRKIAEKQLEDKRIQDAQLRQLEDPNFRNEAELREVRAFKEAAADIYGGGSGGGGGGIRSSSSSFTTTGERRTHQHHHHTRTYDHRLGRYYMWAQTNLHVYVAVHIPTGYADRSLHVSVVDGALGVLRVQPEDSPPVIERRFAFPVHQGAPVETRQSKDRRRMTLAFTKATPGENWVRLFDGDPDYARCMEAPYRLEESSSEAVLEMELPFWIETSEVGVRVTPRGLSVRVGGKFDNLCRTFWRDPESGGSKAGRRKKPSLELIVAEETAWSLDKETRPDTGEPFNLLMVCMVKREPTESERTYKRGEPQDNRFAVSDANPPNRKGVRLFAEDQDDFGLEDDLMALCFLETGATWRPAKPWDKYWGGGGSSRSKAGDSAEQDARVDTVEALPRGARAALDQMLRMDDEEGDDDDDGGVSWED